VSRTLFVLQKQNKDFIQQFFLKDEAAICWSIMVPAADKWNIFECYNSGYKNIITYDPSYNQLQNKRFRF